MVPAALEAGQCHGRRRLLQSASNGGSPTSSAAAHNGDLGAEAGAGGSRASHAPSGSKGSAATASPNDDDAAPSSPLARAQRPRVAHHGPYEDRTCDGSAINGSAP